MNKTYSPQDHEEKIYKKWLDSGCFKADPTGGRPPYSIVIPPPNVTGQLHMGHALDETLQDILTRYKRMAGHDTLWLPGTDHAGIATQIKVEEHLRKDGISRHDLGRDAFLEKAWEWKHVYWQRITDQLKKLGCSCDWSRERFTMDEGCAHAVRAAFVNMYNKGLIYRGNRIINWCPDCATALSDAEVEHIERDGNFWHIKYPLASNPDEFVVIATTRPETMLGDTAVAVHPNDERYKHLIGKRLLLPLMNREIPIVADDYVDMEFGTGAVKITPAHDPNDFEVAVRHDLEKINIMDDNAAINANGGVYQGMSRYDARKKIVADLEGLGLLIKVAPHSHNVGKCYRCSTTVEPLLSHQWFVKMEPLARPAIEAVKSGAVKFVPERFAKTYLNWMENLHDWCISRQLWWGHRIPAFYCDSCGVFVDMEDLEVCPKCGCAVRQDEDVLDTWFSSALWPFSTMGWPSTTADLDKYYPTSVLVTGYDIIFFWVARMVVSGLEHTGKPPFGHVLIHGLVRDSSGRKMSKSLGNGVDPLEIVNQYGADALRFSLATGNAPGNDMRFYVERVEASRNFANKIWNAARFVLQNLEGQKPALSKDMTNADKWIVSALNNLAGEVAANLDSFEIGVAVGKLYDFIWDYFCDWYIEMVKPRLYDADCPTGTAARQTLAWCLSNTMKLLHPVMPFITDEIYCSLTGEQTIMTCEFPVYQDSLSFPLEERQLQTICDCIRAVRNARGEMNIPPSKKADVFIAAPTPELFDDCEGYFSRLASAASLTVSPSIAPPDNCLSLVVGENQIYIPIDQLVDRKKELERLEKEREVIVSEIERAKGKLSNQGFLAKAPQKLVEQEKDKLAKFEISLIKVNESIEKL